MNWEAAAMDFEKMRDYRNAHNPAVTRVGIYAQEIGPGYARVTKALTAEDLNPLGVPHGGVYFSMADTAGGCAMASSGYMAVTLDASFHFLRSAKEGDTLTAEAREVKGGRTICVYEVQVRDQDGTLIASGTFTFFKTDKRIEV